MLDRIKRILKNIFSKSSIPIIKRGLTIVVFLALFANMIYMTLILYDRNYDFKVLNKTYVAAVYPGQDTNQVLKTNIVVIREPVIDVIDENSLIVTYGNYNTTEYWVHSVTSVNRNTGIISYSYDDLVVSQIDIDDVVALYIEDANIIETVYFGATFSRGYILLTISHLFVFSIYYFATYTQKEQDYEENNI